MIHYINKDAVAEIKDLYEDIDRCIGDLVLARSKHDQRGISDAHWKMETLMVNTQQVLSSFINNESNELNGYMEGIIHNNELHVLVFQHHSENRCLDCSLYDLCTEENEYESMRYDLCEKLEPGEVGHFEHVYIPKSYTDEDK